MLLHQNIMTASKNITKYTKIHPNTRKYNQIQECMKVHVWTCIFGVDWIPQYSTSPFADRVLEGFGGTGSETEGELWHVPGCPF